MAGVKGRSGRKSKSDEQKRMEIIEESWDVYREFLRGEATLDKKVEQAIKVVVKHMPAQVNALVKSYLFQDFEDMTIDELIAEEQRITEMINDQSITGTSKEES